MRLAAARMARGRAPRTAAPPPATPPPAPRPRRRWPRGPERGPQRTAHYGKLHIRAPEKMHGSRPGRPRRSGHHAGAAGRSGRPAGRRRSRHVEAGYRWWVERRRLQLEWPRSRRPRRARCRAWPAGGQPSALSSRTLSSRTFRRHAVSAQCVLDQDSSHTGVCVTRVSATYYSASTPLFSPLGPARRQDGPPRGPPVLPAGAYAGYGPHHCQPVAGPAACDHRCVAGPAVARALTR